MTSASKAPEQASTALLAPPPSGTEALIKFTESTSRTDVEVLPYPYPTHDERGDLRIEAVPIASVPKGRALQSVKKLLDEYLPRPERITGTAVLRDEASFVAHVREMREPTTRIFCEPEATPPQFTAVYDYHAVHGGDRQRPAWCEHRAKWPLALAKEWKAWTGQAGKAMTPTEFAEFLELRVPDVYWGDQQSDYTKLLVSQLELRLATPSALIALSRNLAVNVDVQVRQAQTLSSGEIAITYVEQHRDGEGQPIRVPNAFLIAIPVIQGGPSYQLLARLRYRITAGKVSWAYDLHRTDLAFDAAIREICERVQDETERPVFLGSPEA
jgi:uncharacterized protein YfdQ (DUF2303 family)